MSITQNYMPNWQCHIAYVLLKA